MMTGRPVLRSIVIGNYIAVTLSELTNCHHLYDVNSPLWGTPFECSSISLWLGLHIRVCHQVSCGGTFKDDINSGVVGTAFECDINVPMVGTPIECDIYSLWSGHHLNVTSTLQGGDTIRV